jgi:DNA-binding NtrC family response regulator
MEKLVFVIDDDQIYLRLMKSHLRQLNEFVVETYADGNEAIKKLEWKDPYLIILDHNLANNEEDGLFFLKAIKKLKPDVPIFYMTGDRSLTLQKEAVNSGAQKFIYKDPTSLKLLSEAMDELTNPKKESFYAKLLKKFASN